MTSTSFNVGLGDGSRLSSRVLRPPGGGHTDIFGGEPEPPRGRRQVPAASGAMFGHGDEPVKTPQVAEAPKQNGSSSDKVETAAQPEPAQPPAPEPQPEQPAVAATQPETKPEPKPEAKPEVITPEQPKTEAPKRVRVPPGGFSSGLW